MAKDFPDGYRSNVSQSKQDLDYKYSHPLAIFAESNVPAHTTETFTITQRDANHIYVINSLMVSAYDPITVSAMVYCNDVPVGGGAGLSNLQIPLFYDQKYTLAYGEVLTADVDNFYASQYYYIFWANCIVLPMPSGFCRRPLAFFTLDKYTVAHNVNFTPNDECEYSPVSYDWNWGDGSAHSTTAEPTHKYAVAGTYAISLTATNAGGSDTFITYILIT